MPSYIRPLLLIALVNLLIASPAHPWGNKGHEIVAAIADAHLTDTGRKQIKDLLPQGSTLAAASTWPDEVGARSPT